MTADTRQVHRQDDIDLFALIERAILFFKRYRWLFGLAIIAGLVLGYLFYKSIPWTYKSRMVVHSFILSNQEEIQIVKNWNRLLSSGEYATLSAALNIDAGNLRKVKKIKADEIQQVFTPVNPNGFSIDAIVTDN